VTIALSDPRLTTGRHATRPRLRRFAVPVITATLIAAAWFVIAPVSIGGPTSYVVTDGVSMLPHFRGDGLVITRREPSYHVGEVVAYHNRELGVVVMHRIVARDGNRYVFKGDNNNFRDTYHATQSDLVGKEWAYWPGGGRYLGLLRRPAFFGIVLAVLGLFVGRALVPAAAKKEEEHDAS
jgi:signal peptidase I